MVESIMLVNNVTKSKIKLNMASENGYLLTVCNWGNVESSHNSYKYSGQVGESVTDTNLETREVQVVGYVFASNKDLLSQRKRFLNRFVNPKQSIRLYYDKYLLTFFPDTSIQYGTDFEENNNVLCKFQVRGTAYDPMFRETTERKVLGARYIPNFKFPLVISEHLPPIDGIQPNGVVFGYKRKNLILSVYNSGDIPVGFKFIFTAVQDGVVNPSLINIVTQEQFKLQTTLSVSEQVEVNTITGQRSVQGILENEMLNYYKYKDIDSVWLTLAVGDNLFRYDAENGIDGLQVDILYNSEFLEVEGHGEETVAN